MAGNDIITRHMEKPLHEVLKNILGRNLWLQLTGAEVAKPFIQGKPGGGKTASIIAMCKEYNWNLFHLHLPLIPLEDLSGLPNFVNLTIDGEIVQGTRWTFPEILTEIYKLSEEIITVKDAKTKKDVQQKKPCIVLLDDMHLASPGHLTLGFELFSEKKLRTYKIPENVAFILAGNASAKAGTKTQNSAILNRLAIFPVNTDFDNWKTQYAYPNGVNSKIVAFLNSDTYRRFFHEDETVNNPWGSPRSWTYLSTMMNSIESSLKDGEINQQELMYLANAHVTPTAASEFVMFYSIYSKTQMDLVFAGKLAVKIPDDELTKYIYMIAAANEFVGKYRKQEDKVEKEKVIDKIVEILLAIAKTNSEIAMTGLKQIIELEQAIPVNGVKTNTTSYQNIITKVAVSNEPLSKKIRDDILKVSMTN